jgi:hypothetical protein
MKLYYIAAVNAPKSLLEHVFSSLKLKEEHLIPFQPVKRVKRLKQWLKDSAGWTPPYLVLI